MAIIRERLRECGCKLEVDNVDEEEEEEEETGGGDEFDDEEDLRPEPCPAIQYKMAKYESLSKAA